MVLTECEEQDDALAERVNGELTFCPLEGLLMETGPELEEASAVAV